MKRERALKILKLHAEVLHKEHHVAALYLFGSVARGDSNPRSDIDLLVDFSSREVGLFHFIRLKDFLESILGKKIDLVTRDALKDWMIPAIEKDSVRAA